MNKRDCPIARRIQAVNLFICSLLLVLVPMLKYPGKFSFMGVLMMTMVLTLPMIFGGLWYIKPVPRSFISDEIILLYGMTFFTTLAIIKWGTFFYWGIDTRKMPSVYEKWEAIFDLVSIGVAASSAHLPVLIMKRQSRKKSSEPGTGNAS